MKISTTEGKGGRINVFADGEFQFSIDAAVWFGFGLSDGDEIDEDELFELKEESDRRHALSSALNILSRRAHSKKELRDKLKRNFPEASVVFAIEKAEEMGFINDEEYAELLATQLAENKKYAPSRIKQELIFRGISRDTADNTVEDMEIPIEENIISILENKYPDCTDDEKAQRRAINALIRLGYSFNDIRRAIREMENG